jgi:membrane fusion protein, peptide pheromone/bacteriocin exporter
MIFPKEILDNTTQVFAYKNEVKSKVIFGLTSLMLMIGLGATPFVKTDIYVSANGIIKPNMERRSLVSPVTGFLKNYELKDNLEVIVGDTLLKLDDSRIAEQIQKIEAERKIVKDNLADLNYLIFAKVIDRRKLLLPTNRTNYLKFEQKLRELDLRLSQSATILERQSKLYTEGVISVAEYQKITFENDLLKNEKELLLKDQKFIWESERKSENQKLLDFENSLITLKRN